MTVVKLQSFETLCAHSGVLNSAQSRFGPAETNADEGVAALKSLKPGEAIKPRVVGEKVAEAIAANQPYICTYPEYSEAVAARYGLVLDALRPAAINMRVVLDTNIILKAFRSPTGGSAALVRAVRNQKLVMLATPPLFFDYEQVVTRPEQMRAAGASAEDAEDEMVLEAAINGGADALVTFERITFLAAARSFGVEVVTPADILAGIIK